MICFENVSKRFGSLQVLLNCSATFKSGITALIAPSGSGKTTLLRLIAGLEQADSGTITFAQNHPRISMVFQEDRLLPTLTAYQNVLLPCANSSLARDWLERLGLAERQNELPENLSGGMKRCVALARAMAYDSDILLLDEPFKGLDLEKRERVMDSVMQEAAKRTTLLITHEGWEAKRFGDILLYGQGPPLEL